MSELELTPVVDGVDVTVSFEQLSTELGEQYVLSYDPAHDYAYLAALMLETAEDPRYNVTDGLMEYIRNSDEFAHLDYEDCLDIEMILRGERE